MNRPTRQPSGSEHFTDASPNDSEGLCRHLIRNLPAALYTTDAQGRIAFYNGAAAALWGREPELGEEWCGSFRIFRPDGSPLPLDQCPMAVALREGRAVRGEEIVIERPDGTRRHVLPHPEPLRDADGQVIGGVNMLVDITDRRQAESKLAATEKGFRVLAETIPSIVWTAAPDGTLTYVNQRWLEYCGSTPEPSGNGWPALVLHPDDYERFAEQWKQSLRDAARFEFEARYRRHDGAYRWFVVRAEPQRDDGGRVLSWFGVTTDIHDQKEIHEQLRDANRRKDEFLATLAHELRNPLAPIRNSLHILRMNENDASDRQIHDILERQINCMVRLVDDLLEVSRITRGKIDLRRERVELAAILRTAIETSKPLLDAADHRLAISVPAQTIVLEADAVRLAQVFSNLLNNAAKYTDRGGQIWLNAHREDNEVVVAVLDNGVGIQRDMLPRVFDLFTQIDRDSGRAQGGLGIGLTIVRRLVEMHGGRVEVLSDGPGQGSEFRVRLPLAPGQPIRLSAETPSKGFSSVSLPSRRVLVVDDNEDSAKTLGMLLECIGLEVRVENGGAAALQALDEFRPHVVLMDLGMPGMDGCEVARRIRQRADYADILLIALTGWGQPEDRRRCQEAGFNHHLVKPVKLALLEQLLVDDGA